MKKWFFNLKNKTKIIMIILFWALTVAASFYITSDSFNSESTLGAIIAIAYLSLFAFTITLTVWKSDSHKKNSKKYKTNILCSKKKKEVLKNFLSLKGTIITTICCFLFFITLSAYMVFSYNWLIGGITFAMLILTSFLSLLMIYPCISRSKAIVYTVDDVEVGAFFVKNIGIKERSFYLCLVVGNNIVSEEIAVRRYDRIIHDDDAFSQIFNLLCDFEDAYHIQKETKSKEAFVTLKTTLNEMNISLIVNKYTRRLKIFINGEYIKKYLQENNSK